MAIGAVKAIRHRGGRVPDDVAVVGFDDIHMASIFEPSLTTIAQPMFEIGKKRWSCCFGSLKESMSSGASSFFPTGLSSAIHVEAGALSEELDRASRSGPGDGRIFWR